MKSKTTIIVPFYFREKIENEFYQSKKQTQPLSIQFRDALKSSELMQKKTKTFSKDVEPTPVTLLRHWSRRVHPKLTPFSSKKINDNIRDFLIQHEWYQEWENKLKKLSKISLNMNNPVNVKNSIESLSKEFSELIKGIKSNDFSTRDLYGYKTDLFNKFIMHWEPLWPEIESIFGDKGSEPISLKEAQEVIIKTNEIIKKSNKPSPKKKGSDSTGFGLGADSLPGAGLSSSLKHMWSIDDEESRYCVHSSQDSEDELIGINLISGRSIILSLELKIIENIFGGVKFKIGKNRKPLISGVVELERLLIVLSPHQNGYCCFTFNIYPEASTCIEALKEVQNLVHGLVRLSGEYNLIPFNPRVDAENIDAHPLSSEFINFFPKKFGVDGENSVEFNLKDLTLWLIALNDEESKLREKSPIIGRCGYLRKYFHHTSIYFEAKEHLIDSEWYNMLRREAWRTSRANHREPTQFSEQKEQVSHGELLTYDGLISAKAREGTCAISWETQSKDSFNMLEWSLNHYQGTYLLFYLHVLSEEAMLEDLSYQSLDIIKHNLSLSTQFNRKNYLERLKIRDMLKSLIYEMVYLNLSFNSASTGGSSDYMEHLLALKSVYSIDSLREELRANISELSDIVEQIDQEQQQRFDNGLTVLGAIVLPFGVISGLMGMNNFSIGEETLKDMSPSYLSNLSFSGVILGCLMVSVVLLWLARERILPMIYGSFSQQTRLNPPSNRSRSQHLDASRF